jgi:hypothetical protein
VIAFQENLGAAADAHHLMAEFVEARGGIAGAGEGEDGETQHAAVENLGCSRHYSVIPVLLRCEELVPSPSGTRFPIF